TRNSGNGLLGAVPLFLSDTTRLGPPAIPDTPAYPLVPQITDSINTFDPRLQVPSTDSWSAGIQRSLGKDMAVEIRYVGTRSRDGWSPPGSGVGGFNYNEFDITDNGFLNEFRIAQANLQANIAAGPGAGCVGGVTTVNCQNNFAFTGAPGTRPL